MAVPSSGLRIGHVPLLGRDAHRARRQSPNCGILTRGESISEPGDLTPLRSRPVCSGVLATRLARPLQRRSFPCAPTLDGAGRIVIPTPPSTSRSGTASDPQSVAQRQFGLGYRGGLYTGHESQQRPKTPATPRPSSAARRAHPSNPPSRPVNARPAKLPRFPTAAINSIPAAAAVPLRKPVGSAQNTGIAERIPTAASVIATVRSTDECA